MALLLVFPAASWAARTTAGLPASTNAPVIAPLIWQDSLKSALALATLEYQPVFVLFTGPNCPWCTRLKADIAGDAEIQSLLQHFALVEIDVEKNEGIASQYGLRGVPAIFVLSSDGTPRLGVNSYVPATELRNILRSALNPDLLRQRDSAYTGVLGLLRDKALPADKWPDVLRFYGDPEKRKEVHDTLMDIVPFPATNVVPLLQDRRLAVRLGALDILEELSGDTFGYEPWEDVTVSASNTAALARWQAWAASQGEGTNVVYAALSADQISGYLQDLLSDNTERSVRAIRMLRHSGPGTGDAILRFLAAHPELPAGTVKRIKEIQYATTLPSVAGMDASTVAHRLVYGTVDVRLKTIATLPTIGKAALAPIKDFLSDPDAMVREAAVDAAVTAGGRAAVPLVAAQLAKEKDVEVVYAMLRGLGRVQSKQGLALLTSYLSNANEDIVICALNSIARLKSKTASEDVIKCLDDPRWRVRVAALDAVGKLRLSSLSDKLIAMLDDKDEFVRYSAVATLGAVSAKKATKKLEDIFLRDDALKGPIAAAFVSLDVPFPDSFRTALEGKKPEVILAVLDALKSRDSEDVKFAMPFVQHENLDVACTAVRIVAASGLKNAAARGAIADVLRQGRREAVVAALESIRISPEFLASYARSLAPVVTPSGTTNAAVPPAGAPAGSNVVDSILAAFGEDSPAPAAVAPPPPPPPAEPAPPVKGAADDILSAFEEVDAAAPTAAALSATRQQPAGPGVTVETLMRAIEGRTTEDNDKDVRFKSALLLCTLGNPMALPFLETGLTDRSVDERTFVAGALGTLSQTNIIPTLRRLLQDPSDAVREAAIGSCLRQKNATPTLDLLFEELLRDGTRLKPHEVYRYELSNAIQSKTNAKKTVGAWARRILKESRETPMQALALILIELTWSSGDDALIAPQFESTDPYVRRAAYHALGKGKLELFKKRIAAVSKDPAEEVRAVLPSLYMKGSARWVHFFSKDHFESDSHYWSSGDGPRLPDEARQALLTLTTDASSKVRVEAFFCLLSHRQPVDLAAFVSTVDSFPDRRELGGRVAEYVIANYRQLGRNFRVLLPYLMEAREEGESVQQVLKHFDLDADTWQDSVNLVARDGTPAESRATFLDAATNAPVQARALKVIYFTSPGCPDCARVERLLPDMRESFPWLQIEVHDIKKARAMRVNEALCERFGVPEADRLVTPAVFAASGFLIRKDIVFDRLGELLAQSTAVPSDDWAAVPEEALAAADARIDTRFDSLSLFLILQNGLVDGVNPCAFATIIFLISYLQVARRRPGEIAQIALAFIAGVFLAYFVLGLGLSEVIAKITAFQRAGLVVNWILAGATLVFMVLNIRDGVLCLQGRLAETTLQLPGVLKEQIHAVIRRSSRHAHFVVAAFVMGVVISVLELACTGQVYLPTIGYMLQKRGPTFGVVGMLLVYNAAFIVPLAVIFVLTTFGLTAERLTRVLQRHAAVVKFGTAVLFLALFVVFVLSSRL